MEEREQEQIEELVNSEENPGLVELSKVPHPAVLDDGQDAADSEDVALEDTDADATCSELMSDQEGDHKKSIAREILSWVGTICIALVVAILINAYVFRISEVNGPSMQSTLYEGDMVYLSRLPYLFGEPERGDIVVLDSSSTHRNFFMEFQESLQYNVVSQNIFGVKPTKKYWIKRVIGLPGDTIESRNGKLYRNGEPLQEDYVKDNTYVYQDFSVTVSEGYVFVMGDNRGNSRDSRDIGPVPIDNLLGKVFSIQK